MIHIAIGTKAQFIKMAPIVREFKRRGVRFFIQDLAQHKGITPEILRIFDIADVPKNDLVKADSNASNIAAIVKWSCSFLKVLVLGKRAFEKDSSLIKPGDYVLVHGDTLSTLYGAILAKRFKAKVVLIEAGLTSYRLLSPFPEELVRRFVQLLADICFCPGELEFDRLRSKYPQKKVLNTGYNTGNDAVDFVLSKSDQHEVASASVSKLDYVLFTIHRFETIRSRAALSRMIEYLEQVADKYKVIFCMHEPTEKYLKNFDLLGRLHSNDAIEVTTLKPYDQFIWLIIGAKFVVTDGGSIQEECGLLKKRCVIFRESSERNDGVGVNAILTSFNLKVDELRLNEFVLPSCDAQRLNSKASTIVVEELLD